MQVQEVSLEPILGLDGDPLKVAKPQIESDHLAYYRLDTPQSAASGSGKSQRQQPLDLLVQHNSWPPYQNLLFDSCTDQPDGAYVFPDHVNDRWHHINK